MVEVVRLIRSHKTLKGPQFELYPSRILPGAGGLLRILPGAGAEGQHPTVGRTEARMGGRLLGRAMLGQTVVAAIIYGFVGTDKSNDIDHFAKLGFGQVRNYLAR